MPITIEPVGSKDSGICPCCGSISRTVWGEVHEDDFKVAVNFVHWTKDGVVRHGANFDLILGPWGDGTDAADRCGVSLAFRIFESSASFMVIDAAGRTFSDGSLAKDALARSDVIGTPIADAAFAVVDAIWLLDARITEITQAG